MAGAWNVLVVDDDEDVQRITQLALKRKTWRGRTIQVTSATSAARAREILAAPDHLLFHCAVVDVVMESNDAGLQLCDFIRANVARTTRIILRTGQPGVAPPEEVMNDYDIDYYLAKTEVTDARLFMTLRACFRSSLDIAALLAVGNQLRAFTLALRDATTTRETLARIMRENLTVLEEKFQAKVTFVADARRAADVEASFGVAFADALFEARQRNLAPMELIAGEPFGLPSGMFLVLTQSLDAVDRVRNASVGEKLKVWLQRLLQEESEREGVSGIAIRFSGGGLSERTRSELLHDLELFVANWRVADGSLRLQDRLVRERMEMFKGTPPAL